MKRISALDILGEVRRAKRILNRVQAYMEQQERIQARYAAKRQAREQAEREQRANTAARIAARDHADIGEH